MDINFKIIDQVPNVELVKFYNRFKYFILNSPYEGQPKALLEAMSCECIVFGNNVEGINNIINDKVNGFLYESNQDLKTKFDYLNENKNISTEIIHNSRKLIEENFSLESHMKIELACYEELSV